MLEWVSMTQIHTITVAFFHNAVFFSYFNSLIRCTCNAADVERFSKIQNIMQRPSHEEDIKIYL